MFFSPYLFFPLKLIYASFAKPLTPSSVQRKIFAPSMRGFIRIHSDPVSFIFACLIIFHLEQETV